MGAIGYASLPLTSNVIYIVTSFSYTQQKILSIGYLFDITILFSD